MEWTESRARHRNHLHLRNGRVRRPPTIYAVQGTLTAWVVTLVAWLVLTLALAAGLALAALHALLAGRLP